MRRRTRRQIKEKRLLLGCFKESSLSICYLFTSATQERQPKLSILLRITTLGSLKILDHVQKPLKKLYASTASQAAAQGTNTVSESHAGSGGAWKHSFWCTFKFSESAFKMHKNKWEELIVWDWYRYGIIWSGSVKSRQRLAWIWTETLQAFSVHRLFCPFWQFSSVNLHKALAMKSTFVQENCF